MAERRISEGEVESFDRAVDTVYIRLRDLPSAFGEDLDRERHIDIGADRVPIGVELLCASGCLLLDDLPERETVSRLLREHGIPIVSGRSRGARSSTYGRRGNFEKSGLRF